MSKLSGTFRAWVVVVVVMFSLVIGGQELRARDADRVARECGALPAVREHFKAILADGETQSDWLTHMPPKCRRTMYFAGLQLSSILDEYEVPFYGEGIDNH